MWLLLNDIPIVFYISDWELNQLRIDNSGRSVKSTAPINEVWHAVHKGHIVYRI